MGVLWVAKHRALGSEVVVKFLNDELTDGPSAAKRIAREAALAARVKSPHVVQVLDHGVSEGTPFIVMELLEGCDLRAHLEARGVLTPEETIVIARQLAKALAKAHSAGVVHQDVKPSNIFLCDVAGEVFVKLLDFGLARRCASSERSSTESEHCAGTPAYMSPEQILGGKVDASSDVWSLGVVAFQCLTGRRPFQGETFGAVALAIHTLPLSRLTDINTQLPAAIDAWFARACSRPPAQRFGSAIDAVDAMSAALQTDAARVDGPVAVAGQPERRNSGDVAVVRVWRPPLARPRRTSRVWVASLAVAAASIAAAAGAYRAASQPNRMSPARNVEATATSLPDDTTDLSSPRAIDNPPEEAAAVPRLEVSVITRTVPQRPPAKATARGSVPGILPPPGPSVSSSQVAPIRAVPPRNELPDERH
jgi:serine/threonine-protein kinase